MQKNITNTFWFAQTQEQHSWTCSKASLNKLESLLQKRLGAPHFPRPPASQMCSRCHFISLFSVQTCLFRDSDGWPAVSFHYLCEGTVWWWFPFFVGGTPPVYSSSHKWQSQSHKGSSVFLSTVIVNYYGSSAYSPICMHLQCFLSTMDDMETAWESR